MDCQLIQSPFSCYFSSVLTAQAPSTAVLGPCLLTSSWRTKHSQKGENAEHVQQYLDICCALIAGVMSCLQNPGVVLIVCNRGLFAFSGWAELRLASFPENCSSDLQYLVLGQNIVWKASMTKESKLSWNKLEQNMSIGSCSVLLPLYLC